MYNLTGIYWIKDEAPYLAEYLEFHLLQGFDHFIFYDNGSTDDTVEVLAPYVRAGLVELRTYPQERLIVRFGPAGAKNFWVMEHCIEEQRGLSKWIHFHSIDERVFCTDFSPLPTFLEEFEPYGGLSVCWEEFNSNGHQTKPEGLLIENYTRTCTNHLYQVKTIIQPMKADTACGNPHNFRYLRDWFSVNENHVRVDGASCPQDYSFRRIKNHHYRTLSRQEFNAKMNKGVLDVGPRDENAPRWDAQSQWWMLHDEANEGVNTDLVPFAPLIREKIRQRYA